MRINTDKYSRALYMWNGVSAIFMFGGVTPPHSHNTMQIVFDLRNTFKCKISNTDWQFYKAVVIRENVIHQLNPNESVQLLLYLDAEAKTAREIRSKYLSGCDISPLDFNILDYVKPGELEKGLVKSDIGLLENIVFSILNKIIDGNNPFINDARIQKVISLLQEDHSAIFTIRKLTNEVHLSESRLRFLFKKLIGVPLHRYIIWNRIMLALKAIMNGETIENAAIEFGFADTSHFHKMLVKMFGVSPSQFLKNTTKRQLYLLTHKRMKMETRFYDEGIKKISAIHTI